MAITLAIGRTKAKNPKKKLAKIYTKIEVDKIVKSLTERIQLLEEQLEEQKDN